MRLKNGRNVKARNTFKKAKMLPNKSTTEMQKLGKSTYLKRAS